MEVLKTIIRMILRPFKRFKIFAIYCSEEITESYEDPRCPSRWRGSGCYDIEVYTLRARLCLVTARDEREAINIREKYLVEAYDYEKRSMARRLKSSPAFWWEEYINERIGGNMEIISVEKTAIPVFSSDKKRDFLDEICQNELISSERENDISCYTEEKIISSFSRELNKWSISHTAKELERLNNNLKNESSHILRLFYSKRGENLRRYAEGRI